MTNHTDPTDLLRRAEAHLSALHGSVARHDNLGVNLGCAGCELRDEIRAELDHLQHQLGRLRDQLAILGARRPTPAELAGEYDIDKDVARRIHKARPGIPPHHILATLDAFRAVLEMEPGELGYCPSCGRGDITPTADEYEQQRQRAETARATLDEVLRQFTHKGHPGEPCLQTGWISERTVARWRAALDEPGPAATQATDAETTTRVFAALHRSAEDTVTRVINLHEQWVKAGPPPLGVSPARWWDKRLAEHHNAIQPPTSTQEQP